MPSWKKIITSGSDASLAALFVTNAVTSSVFSGSRYIGASFTGSLSGSITAPGSSTNVIYNSSGVLAGSNNFIFDGSNVGIGTTNITPFSGLFSGRLVVEAGTGNIDGAFLSTNNTNAAELILSKRNPTNNFGSLLIQHSGSSGDAIAINYGVNMTTGVGGVNSFKVTTGGNGYFAGNVGIGTTSPAYKLDVGGTLRTTSNILAGNVISLIGAENNSAKIKAGKFLSIADDGFIVGINYTSDSIPFSGYNLMVNGNTYSNGNIIASGNVGIGATSPATKLHISGSADIRLSNNANSTGYDIGLLGGNTDANAYVYQRANAALILGTNNTDRIRILGNGDVGIGTTNPTEKITSTGNLYLNSNDPYIYWDSNYIRFKTKTNSIPVMELRGSTGGGFGSRFYMYAANDSAVNVLLDSEGSSYFTGGNIGIGTTSPNYKFHVVGRTLLNNGTDNALLIDTTVADGTTRDAIYLYEDDGQATGRQAISWANGTQNYYKARIWTEVGSGYGATTFGIDVANNAQTVDTRLAIRDGNVGIGTTIPSYKLAVRGSSNNESILHILNSAGSVDGDTTNIIRITANNNSLWANARYDAFAHIWYGNGSETMRLTSNGNLGIGTTSPVSKLHIGSTNSDTGTQMVRISTVVGSADTVVDALHIDCGGSNYNQGVAISMGLKNATYNNFLSRIITYLDTGVTQATKLQLQTQIGGGTTWNTGILIDGSGNIGINTVSPSYKLDVNGVTRFQNIVRFKNNSWNLSDDGYNRFYFAENARTYFGSGDGYEWRSASDIGLAVLTNSGNLGIGTTAPTSKLHLSSSSNPVIFVESEADGDSTSTVLISGNKSGIPNYTATTLELRSNIDYRGRGILMTYTGGSEKWFAGVPYTGGGYQIGYSTTAPYDPPNAALYINSSKNIGIGTTTPSYKLDIAGASVATTAGTQELLQRFSVTTSNADYLELTNTRVSNGSTWETAGFRIQQKVDSTWMGYIQFNGNNNGGISFGTGLNSGGPLNISEALRIVNGGNVGIGTTSPAEKLQVDGTIVTDYTIADTQGYRLIKPKNGTYITQTDTVTGAIKITYPVGYTNTMHIIKLKVYEYVTNESFTITFGGYNYAPTPSWYNCFAYIEGNPVIDRNFTVRFGYDGTYMVVYIGELSSTWSYPQVFIEEVGLGYGGVSSTWRNNNWGVGFEASAFSNVTATVSNTAAHTFVRDGANAYYSLGSVGIGASSPAYKLDVLGTIRATGDVIAYSDARVKDNVKPIENALEKLTSLRGVSYNRKDTDDKSRKIGVIAQEVLPIIPEVVSKDQNGNYSVAYGNMVGLLIEAVKEQQKQIDELKYLLENKKKKK